jgi:hypothetical protein
MEEKVIALTKRRPKRTLLRALLILGGLYTLIFLIGPLFLVGTSKLG